MKYITGEHALNIKCSLDTSGDWHFYSMDWNAPAIKESDCSIFGSYGIETNAYVPPTAGTTKVANHIRALLDLLEDGNFAIAKGMRDCFIGNDKYNDEIFAKVYDMRDVKHWDKVDRFMGSEYYMKWENYKKAVSGHG